MRSTAPLLRSAAAALLVLVSACGGRVRAVRVPEAAPVAVEPVDLLAPPWRLGNGRAERAQRIVVVAQLTSRVDSLTRVDSIASALEVRWGDGESGSSSRALPVHVTRFAVRGALDTLWRTPPGVMTPFALSATLAPGAVPLLCVPAAAACLPAQLAAAQGWQESWVGLPAALERGTTWSDSTNYTVTRDSIPLRVLAVRHFIVREAVLRDGAVVVLIDRRSTQALTGEGRQFGEVVRITGDGKGVMRLEVALANGAVLRGEGTAVLTLTLVGRRRTQELTQSSHLTITAP